MEKGIIIEKRIRGIYVDGKLRREFDDIEKFVDAFSEYIFFEYWDGAEPDICQGDLCKGSLFLQSIIQDAGPFGGCFNNFSYFTDVKFAAGYLKYIMLGDLCCSELASDVLQREGYELQDVDELIVAAEKSNTDASELISGVKYIISLCNNVFATQEQKKQMEYLEVAIREYNKFCETTVRQKTGRYYLLEVFEDIDKAKDEILEYISSPEEKQKLEKAFLEPEWGKVELEVIEDALFLIA